MNFKQIIMRFPTVAAFYWNNKWEKGNILYKFSTDGTYRDVKEILESSHPHIIDKGTWFRGLRSDDPVALSCLKWVRSNITYKSDKEIWQKPEHWQEAPETFARRTGDCEDGAILLMKLMEGAGIPAWRRKICAGFVIANGKKVGHAYVIYLADDFEWYVLDWCYWSLTSIGNFKVKPHRLCKEYDDVWFTFNEEYAWHDQTYPIKLG